MGRQEHPMVPVPEAIRTVLRETARIFAARKDREGEEIAADANGTELLGRTLQEDVLMQEPGYPPYNASIMDGYAVKSIDCRTSDQVSDWTHQVVDNVYAGDEQAPAHAIESSSTLPSAYYITTGAVVPANFDCVVPIEECQVSHDKKTVRVQTSAAIQALKWIRPVGCDIAAGSIVLPRGHQIDPVSLGLLKQSGASKVRVVRQLKVGVLSTGNELILGSKDASIPGKIPDVNRPILLNLVNSFGGYCQTVDLGNERDDDVDAMARTMNMALEECDVVITTGGISMGDTDIVEQVLVEKCGGTLHFGRMHMKPGKPTTFITIPKNEKVRIVFAMPGNPVSATVCTQLLVKPCLDLLFHGPSESVSGETTSRQAVDDKVLKQWVNHALVHPELEVTLAHDIKLDQSRPEYHRVTLVRDSVNGMYQAVTTGVQRSSRLMSCRDAQALLALPVGSVSKPKALAGETYPALLLKDLRGFDRLEVQDSIHLKKKARESRVGVVQVIPHDAIECDTLESTCQVVQNALSGSKSGTATIVSQKTCSGDLNTLYSSIIDSNEADTVVVVCPKFKGSFGFHLDVVAVLNDKLQKSAHSLAMQAREGAASEDPTAALFEVVAGYAPEGRGAMVVLLPGNGLAGGLRNVRGLLKHAVNVARGKPHNHHHTHSHHDHVKAL